MRVLFDIVHPADVLLFYHPIMRLRERGDEVLVLSREKDVACRLLDELGIAHRTISAKGTGTMGLARELVQRDFGMWREVRRSRPDVMIGLGGVAIAHAGWLTGRPSIAFYAADTAKLQTRLTWPFITHLYVPEVYQGQTPEGRTTRFPGIKELSYFHPDNFTVDEERAGRAGWQPGQDCFLIRMVAWGANHDIGKTGWSDGTLAALVEFLSARGKVVLSTERELPADLQPYLYRGEAKDLHHLMAKCALYVGESATMAHEAALLGTPAIYDGADHPGTTRDLAANGLVTALRQPGEEALLAEVARQLEPAVQESFDAAREGYLDGKGNLADFIVGAIDRHAA